MPKNNSVNPENSVNSGSDKGVKHEWINWIKQGKGLYFNKEKVLNLLDQQQMTPAEVAFGLPAEQAQQGDSKPKLILSCDDIESIINIVNNFNNLK